MDRHIGRTIVRNSAGDARVIWSIFSGYHPQGLRESGGLFITSLLTFSRHFGALCKRERIIWIISEFLRIFWSFLCYQNGNSRSFQGDRWSCPLRIKRKRNQELFWYVVVVRGSARSSIKWSLCGGCRNLLCLYLIFGSNHFVTVKNLVSLTY